MLEHLAEAKSWPFVEARRIIKRLERKGKKTAVIQTGFGPSGLPHIGTFGEVVRSNFVKRTFDIISQGQHNGEVACYIQSFSDDLDALRKIPDNVPNSEAMASYLGFPLTDIPDPFATHSSFGAHNNARLQAFLDGFGFECRFKSATEVYKSGFFDPYIKKVLEKYDEIMAIMLPTLGEERQQSYSPILPICQDSGKVLNVQIKKLDADEGWVVYDDPQTGKEVKSSVLGGRAKLQWKADWAMRWRAFGVDFEMHGKDLTPSVILAKKICRILGGDPPETYVYELFLDEEGRKISKSKGNGLSVESWLKYGDIPSLALFMCHKPATAKRLYFDIIPKYVDEYAKLYSDYDKLDDRQKLDNGVFHIDRLNAKDISPVSYALLLNIVSASNSSEASILFGFVLKLYPDLDKDDCQDLVSKIDKAIVYYKEFY